MATRTAISSQGGKKSLGFTLLEVLAAILILSILAAMLLPNLRQYIDRAGEVVCISRMRSITVGLHNYLQDHNALWPQGPSLNEPEPWEKFWLAVLQPYDISEKVWQCPTVNSRLASLGQPLKDRPKVAYIPTMFSAEAGIANRWSTQPWLIERTSAHEQGPFICFPDGSVKSFFKVLAEHGVR